MAIPAPVATALLLPCVFPVIVFWEGQKCEVMDLLLVCQGSWEAPVLTGAVVDAGVHSLRLVAVLKS